MLVAERYILRRILAIATLSLGSILALVLVTQVLIFVNVVTDSGEAIWTFMSLGVMLIPSVGGIVLPFALLIGVCHTLNTMHIDSEIVVLESAGASHGIQIRPVMLVALVMSALTLVNSLYVEPAANRNLRDIINNAGSNLVRFAVRSGSFHRLEDNLYIQIAGQLPGGDFEGIFIADSREADTDLIYYARLGRASSSDGVELLVMSDGEIQRRNASTGEVSIITFSNYALDFASFRPAGAGGNYFPKERTTLELISPDPNDRVFQQIPHRLRGELHRRLSEWLYPMAFGVIALFFSVGARSNREERVWGLVAAVGVALAYRGVGFLVVNDSGRYLANALILYLLPLSCIAFFGGLLLAGRRASIPQSWLDRIGALAERTDRFRERIAGGFGAASRFRGRATK